MPSNDAFQVDLHGLVDLLSHNLYSSPRIFVRELLQNGVDALTAAGPRPDDHRPGIMLVGSDVSTDGRMHCLDSGIGLDDGDVRTFLTTIGGSSKRGHDETLLGRFGIGLLSCFIVTDQIEVLTRKDDGPVVRWIGHGDGTHEMADPAGIGDERAAWLAEGPGTCIALRPSTGTAQWLTAGRITELARTFGAYLPYRIVSARASGAPAPIAPTTPPWRLAGRARRRECERLARQQMGVEPFAVLPVAVPAAGLDGVVVILGQQAQAGSRGGHRVHLHGMLVSEDVPGLLPGWAFFARAVVDSTRLTPTASREGLYEDDVLEQVRTGLGEQIRHWIMRLAATDPGRIGRFLAVHAVAAKAMALSDDELFETLLPVLRFETNTGETTLPELAGRTDAVHVARTIEDYRQVAAVGAAQGIDILNGGYVYDAELALRAPRAIPGLRARALSPQDLDAHIRTVGEERLRAARPGLERARHALRRLDVDVELRAFAPASMSALYLDDEGARAAAASDEVAAGADDTWAALLATMRPTPVRPRLLLNDDNALVRRVLALGEDGLVAPAVESLYARALLAAGHRLRAADLAAVDHSFLALLTHVLEADDG
ncbi:HSP90 family protein [uncultured Propionibacterium sp.]|uniref:HSP90 family protein n=1 Tax=uncultured Propionibacterium sp. TaxID=218066 RepID=UPI00292D52BE|nr:HSP90 family protein [uncultured Propionibacterium sp.]